MASSSTVLNFWKAIAIAIVFNNGLGSALHAETNPKPYTIQPSGVLNISCVSNGTMYPATQVVMVELLKEGGSPIAFLREQALTRGSQLGSNMKVEGHVKKDASESYLRLTIINPEVEDGGEYTCRLFYQDAMFELREERAHVNVTINKPVKPKGSTLRIESSPEPFTEVITDELNITCTSNGTIYPATQIVLFEIIKDGGSPIAVMREQAITAGPGLKENMEVEGHVKKDASQGYLTVTIRNPGADDVGGYTCQMFYENNLFELKVEKAYTNVTMDNGNVNAVLGYLARKVSMLEKAAQVQAGVISQQSDKIQDQAKQLEAQQNQLVENESKDRNATQMLANLQALYLNQSLHIQEHEKQASNLKAFVSALQTVIKEHKQIINGQGNGTDQDVAEVITSLRDNFSNIVQTVLQQGSVIRGLEHTLRYQEVLMKKQNDSMVEYESKLEQQKEEIGELKKELKDQNATEASSKAAWDSIHQSIDRHSNMLIDIANTLNHQEQVIKHHNESIAECRKEIGTPSSTGSPFGIHIGRAGGSLTSAFSMGYDSVDVFDVGRTMKFTKKILNMGENYDTETGIYTAPVKGLYVFHLVVTTASRDWAVEIDLMSNKNKLASLHARDEDHWDQSSISTVVSLKPGDEIKPVVTYKNTGNTVISNDYYSVFTGYLLYTL